MVVKISENHRIACANTYFICFLSPYYLQGLLFAPKSKPPRSSWLALISTLSGAKIKILLAIFCTLLGHSVFSWGLKYLPPTFIATVKLLEPVLASVMGWILFRENPGWQVAVGGCIVIAGIALYGKAEENKE